MIKHDIILSELERRIKEYDRYSIIRKNMDYEEGKLRGEVDLLCYDDKFNEWHFYEVKSTLKISTYNKAMVQYKRFMRAYPDLNIKGILVHGKGVERLYSNI